MMPFVIAGTGYTGGRVLESIDDGIGIGRSLANEVRTAGFFSRDLDKPPIESIRLDGRCSLLYTIPPIENPAGDARLAGLIDAIEPTPQRIVYLSTSGVYGDRQGALTDESVLPAPQSARAKRRVASELQLLELCSKSDCDAVILRVPGIYGPGRLRLEQLQSGLTVLTEKDAHPGSRIHVDDLVHCCIAALQPAAPPGIYNVGDGDFRSSTWFASKVAELAGIEPPPEISRETAEQTLSPLRLSFLRESRKLDTTKMREVLGVMPHYQDPEDGIRASLTTDGLL
jgi:nucleoside-diphosphate-sugar epimerase